MGLADPSRGEKYSVIAQPGAQLLGIFHPTRISTGHLAFEAPREPGSGWALAGAGGWLGWLGSMAAGARRPLSSVS